MATVFSRPTWVAMVCAVMLMTAYCCWEVAAYDGPADNAGLPIRWPARLQGSVTCEDGAPIPAGKVRIDLLWVNVRAPGMFQKLVYSQTTTTDSAGHYTIATSDFPTAIPRPFYLRLTAFVPGFVEGQTTNVYNATGTAVRDIPRNLKVLAARMVRGRCLDPQGKPVAGAMVDAMYEFPPENGIPNYFPMEPRQTDQQGEFELAIPLKAGARAWVCRPDFVAELIEFAPDENLAEISLSMGTSLIGSVRDEHNRPVAGAAVVLEHVAEGVRPRNGFTYQLFQGVLTDDAGEYRLPPALGRYKVYVTNGAQAAMIAENQGEYVRKAFVVAEGPTPLIVPRFPSFTISERVDQRMDLNVAPSIKVRGQVHWPDGKVGVGVNLQAVYSEQNPDGTSLGVTIAAGVTDDRGMYQMTLPVSQGNIRLVCHIAYTDDKGVHHFPIPVGGQANRPQIDVPSGQQVDMENLDWVLSPR